MESLSSYLIIQLLYTILLVLERRSQGRSFPFQSPHLPLQLLSIRRLLAPLLQTRRLGARIPSRLEVQPRQPRPRARLLANGARGLLPRWAVLHPLLDAVLEIKTDEIFIETEF